MKDTLYSRCELFVHNRNLIKESFKWEGSYIYPLCASIFTNQGVVVNPQVLKECRNIVKKKTGTFSNFRGCTQLAIASYLAMEREPECKFDEILYVYDLLKGEFYSSEYLTVAALVITNMVRSEQYSLVVTRARKIYNLMKKEHPFLTSSEDCIYAVLLAMSERKEELLISEMEYSYKKLKSYFCMGNSVQSLSHVLTLVEGDADVKCHKTIELYEQLRSIGCKYGTNYELASLGVLALVGTDNRLLSQDIMEVNQYLKTKSGFGVFGIGEKQRLMYAGMLVAKEYIGENVDEKMNITALNSTISIVIAQEAAMCAAIAASSAAAASSSTSS